MTYTVSSGTLNSTIPYHTRLGMTLVMIEKTPVKHCPRVCVCIASYCHVFTFHLFSVQSCVVAVGLLLCASTVKWPWWYTDNG